MEKTKTELTDLPDDCTREIFSFLPLKEEMKCRKVSKKFKKLIDNNPNSNSSSSSKKDLQDYGTKIEWKIKKRKTEKRKYSFFKSIFNTRPSHNKACTLEVFGRPKEKILGTLKEFLENASKHLFSEDFCIEIILLEDIEDKDLKIFGKEEYKELKERICLDISRCHRITKGGFKHLKGIHTLKAKYFNVYFDNYRNLSCCPNFLSLENLLKQANDYLNDDSMLIIKMAQWTEDKKLEIFEKEEYKKLKERICLDISIKDDEDKLTNKAFEHLNGIFDLKIDRRTQSITDEAFENLKGICNLSMRNCTQFTYKAIVYLGKNCKLNKLDITNCSPKIITTKSLSYLLKIPNLYMDPSLEKKYKELQNSYKKEGQQAFFQSFLRQ